MPSPIAACLLWSVLAQVPPPTAPAETSASLRKEHRAILDREAKALEAAASRLGGDVPKLVEGFREPPPEPDGSSRFLPLGEFLQAGSGSAKVPDAIRLIRLETARELFALADRLLRPDPNHLALADECLRETVARDPSHPEAHRLLGYVPDGEGWATPFAVKQVAEGFVPHPTYGWVEKGWVEPLGQGLLPAPLVPGRPARWLPAAQADELRRDFAHGWQIRTEHFSILTNVPLSEAIRFGRHLESLEDLFGSMMADVVGAESPMVALARDPKVVPGPPKKVYRVFYFAEKDQYVRFLLPTQGEGVHNSLGTYLPAKEAKRLGLKAGTSFFFRDPGGQIDVIETLSHEVSHQLLFESAGTDRYEAARANYWVFEGLGTYFETLRIRPDGSVRIGGLIGKRIGVARDRLVTGGELIPIARLVSYSKPTFTGDDGGDIFLKYAESMALAVYLLQGRETAYREDFLEYVRDIYRGRLRGNVGQGLDARIGVGYPTLDRELLAYLRSYREPAPKP